MISIIIISCVFPPEPIVSAQTSAQLAEWLAQQGHKVTVVTNFPNRPAGKLYVGYQRRWNRSEQRDGIRVVRCFTTLSDESSLLSRFLENLSFGMSSGWALLREARPDVIYTNSWPIFATGILMLIARLRRIPMVLSIQDVYPESLVVQGRMNKVSVWVNLLRNIDTWISHQAKMLIVISERFAQIYRESRQVEPEKIIVVPNWGDEGFFAKRNAGTSIREKYSIDNQAFLVVYGGNIGVAAGLKTVIRAVGLIPGVRNIRLLLAGEGSQLSNYQELAGRISPKKITFHTPWPSDETVAVLKAADILILPTLGRQSSVSIPSKLITYMFSCRPVIALVIEDSDTAEVIRQARCGWILPPGQSKQLAVLIDEISHLPKEELDGMGESGRQYALENFSSSVNLSKVLAALSAKS